MESTNKSTNELNVNDVIEITLSIDSLIPDEDFETKTVLYDNDYEHDYNIDYLMADGRFANTSFHMDAGCYPDYGDDIEGCIKEELPLLFPEVADYEIFDVNNSGSEYKTAKVRIKSVKEV